MNLLEEINLTQVIDPEKKLPPKEDIKRVVEIVDEDLRKIYSYCCHISSQEYQTLGTFTEVYREVMSLYLRRERLLEVFWLEVKKRYYLMDEKRLSIHQGWKVVVSN